MTLVVGSSGMLGGMIVRKLLERGHSVRVLVRQPTAIVGVEAVTGDLKNRASLDAACAGVTTVITTANSVHRGGGDTVTSVDLNGNRNLIDAAKKAGVRQFVFISVAGADVNSPVPLFAAKARTETHLLESGMAWTIIAPHVFLDVWFPMLVGSALASAQPVSLVRGGRTRHSFIAADDVAEFASRAVDHPAAIDRRLVLGGPDALSWSEIVAMTSQILGRSVPVQIIEPGQPIASLPAPFDRIAGGLAVGLEQQDVIIDMTEPARTFGVSLTPAETIVRRLLAQ